MIKRLAFYILRKEIAAKELAYNDLKSMLDKLRADHQKVSSDLAGYKDDWEKNAIAPLVVGSLGWKARQDRKRMHDKAKNKI